MRKKLVVVFVLLLLACKAVQFVCYKNPKKISIATWNVQTFFDADFSGSEYSEYSSTKSGWNSE